jgi:hypothetical protein
MLAHRIPTSAVACGEEYVHQAGCDSAATGHPKANKVSRNLTSNRSEVRGVQFSFSKFY